MDYFNFTLPVRRDQEEQEVERLKGLLGAAWEPLEGMMYRYQSRVRCGNIWILWNGLQEGMGVHVQASGQGCRELEARGVTDWIAWFADRIKEGARFSQTHFAYDVKDGSLTVDMVEAAALGGLVSSHFDTLEPKRKVNGRGEVTDRGFYFGNRGGNTQVCFYDKALEQRKKQLKTPIGAEGAEEALRKQQELEASWTRVELRNRNQRAQALVLEIIEQGWKAVAGVLSAALDFKERGEGAQRCRWKSQRWWLDFIGWAEKLRLKLDPVVRTLETAMRALERQYGGVLAACDAVVPDFGEWLRDLIRRKGEYISPRHVSMMVAYSEARSGSGG